MRVLSNSTETAEFALGPVQLAGGYTGDLEDSLATLWRGACPASPAPEVAHGFVEAPALDNYTVAIVEQAGGSQFDALMELLRHGHTLPDGCATLALAGTKFHGQRNRAWVAHRGNLHLCVYYQPRVEAEWAGVGFTMLPAVAVADTIQALCGTGLPIGIKWVNDVRVNRRKVSGVLTATQAAGTILEHVVFGIGVNISIAPELEPSPFVPRANSLCAAYGRSYSLPDFLPGLLATIDRRYRQVLKEGPEPLFQAYAAYLEGVGANVTIYPEEPTNSAQPIAHGVLRGLHRDLSLAVTGQAEPVRRGRMVLRGEDETT